MPTTKPLALSRLAASVERPRRDEQRSAKSSATARRVRCCLAVKVGMDGPVEEIAEDRLAKAVPSPTMVMNIAHQPTEAGPDA